LESIDVAIVAVLLILDDVDLPELGLLCTDLTQGADTGLVFGIKIEGFPVTL
jgi:hypothetical protein